MKKNLIVIATAALFVITGCSTTAETAPAPISTPTTTAAEETGTAKTVTKVVVPAETEETVIVENAETVEEAEEAAAWQAWDAVGAGEVYAPEGGRVEYVGAMPSNYQFEVTTETVTPSAPAAVGTPRVTAPSPVAPAPAPAAETKPASPAAEAPKFLTENAGLPLMGKVECDSANTPACGPMTPWFGG